MNQLDAEKINEARKHLTMARVVLDRISITNQTELEGKIDLTELKQSITKYDDQLGNIYLDWSRQQ